MLFDPYSGRFSPAPGPNRLWNQNNASMGVVNQNKNINSNVNLSQSEAVKQAERYLQKNGSQLTVKDDGYVYNGYYTLYTAKQDEKVGMISINTENGEVWYHN